MVGEGDWGEREGGDLLGGEVFDVKLGGDGCALCMLRRSVYRTGGRIDSGFLNCHTAPSCGPSADGSEKCLDMIRPHGRG